MQLEIRPDPEEVRRARKWARSRLAGLGIAADEPLAETLILLVSELVTNAVVHTGRPALLRLSLPGGAAGGPEPERDAETGATGDARAAVDTRGAGATGAAGAAGVTGAAGDGAAPEAARDAEETGVTVVSATVRLEVADASSRAPVPRCAGDDATGGRGLALVDCLADRWGWQAEGAGKSIWCELDRCSPPREGVAMAYGGGMAAYEDFTFEAV
ncbi:ATP-binding protein [Streptomyces sp. NPDC026659]|uniref:ATP-binding protein n=1 Tax=Streptomyces sp. NPDC026659 TaxID=3155123 RepID=UPI0033ECBAC7